MRPMRGLFIWGSTPVLPTTKAVLMGKDRQVLYTYYGSNEGSPVDKVKEILDEVYEILPEKAYIAGSASTGYGEKLIQAAFNVDEGRSRPWPTIRRRSSFSQVWNSFWTLAART
ncbi:MAG: hypothetical protein ACLR23_29920 [Clostridia bacterium]